MTTIRAHSLSPPVVAGLSLALAWLVGAGACTRTDGGGTTGVGGASTTIASATTSSAGGADAGAAKSCPGTEGPIDPTALIDDMEDGDMTIALISGRDGEWWTVGDATPGASIVPNGATAPEMIPGGRCDSHYAIHVTGQGFKDWGAQLLVPLGYRQDDGGAYVFAPYDVSTRQGVTFWARIGDTSVDTVRFGYGDTSSRPEAGVCIVDGPLGQACYDTFGIMLTHLSTDWEQYRIPFAGLSQRMFGVQADALDTHGLYTIEINFAPDAVFDFWLDDIAFY